MGGSEMLFVGGFTVICIGASTLVCKLVVADLKERAAQYKSDMYRWQREYTEQRDLKLKWHHQSESWKEHCERADRENTLLRRQIAELQRSRHTQQSTPSLEGKEKTIMVKALKKAMFDAHPDRGGKSEEFIEINKLYKKLK